MHRDHPPITVVLADDANELRAAVKRILEIEPRIVLIGEAVSLPQTLEMCTKLKPSVVLLDLHMPGEHLCDTDTVKSELRRSAEHILAISIWTDENAQARAADYGAKLLLDKAKLGTQLIPEILRLVSNA